ncbi:hypothetical protein Zmor_018386 [Zophobas morio]|uniref:Beta-ketoacyl synthase C-terminal domain-containing protein n=1 Tax=Zophobas morio TaxID=2755281 RepID=A0AA38MDF1_9CUCU|nr:hypothetical protein Zmor_018386 [Zophobas morio]
MYKESNIDFSKQSYVEAHGTGTQAGDLEEANAIDRPLAKDVKNRIQYSYKIPEDSIEETARNALPYIENCLFRNISFYMIGYSFGTLVGLEMISLLEEKGYPGIMILIDGSPTYITSSLKKQFPHQTDAEF